MADLDLSVLRELFNSRFDALEAKISAMSSSLEKDNDRQDEAIERLADRTTHVSETRRLTERVIKIEDQIEVGRSQLAETRRLTERVAKLEDQVDASRSQQNDLIYKVKVTWAVGTAMGGIFISILAAVIKGWIGV